MNNLNRRIAHGVRLNKFLLTSLLAVIMLLAGFFIAVPKAIKASAESGSVAFDFSVIVDDSLGKNVIVWDIVPTSLIYFAVIEEIYPSFSELSELYANDSSSVAKIHYFEIADYPLKRIVLESYVSGSGCTAVALGSTDLFFSIAHTDTLTFISVPIFYLPADPVKEGYTFVGWYLDEALTIAYNGEPITADMTFYAKFTINTFTVTFDSAGGSSVANQIVNWNTVAIVPTPTRVGYDFLGWYIGDTKYEGAPIKANTALVAKWLIKTYTVTFMVDGEVYKTLKVEHGTSLEQAMEAAGMRYFNNMTDGKKDGKSGLITGDTVAEAAAMTKIEKVATFLASNVWILWTAGSATVLFIGLVIILIVKKARG